MKRAIALMLLCAISVSAQSKKTVDKKFIALTALSIGAAVADEEISQYLLAKNPNLHEANPLLGSTRKTAYPVIAGMTALSTYFAYRAKKAGDSTWWIPSTVHVGIHTFAISWSLTR